MALKNNKETHILDLPLEVLVNIAEKSFHPERIEQLSCFDRYHELHDVDKMVGAAGSLALTSKIFYLEVQATKLHSISVAFNDEYQVLRLYSFLGFLVKERALRPKQVHLVFSPTFRECNLKRCKSLVASILFMVTQNVESLTLKWLSKRPVDAPGPIDEQLRQAHNLASLSLVGISPTVETMEQLLRASQTSLQTLEINCHQRVMNAALAVAPPGLRELRLYNWDYADDDNFEPLDFHSLNRFHDLNVLTAPLQSGEIFLPASNLATVKHLEIRSIAKEAWCYQLPYSRKGIARSLRQLKFHWLTTLTLSTVIDFSNPKFAKIWKCFTELEELNLHFASMCNPFPQDVPGLLSAIAKGPKKLERLRLVGCLSPRTCNYNAFRNIEENEPRKTFKKLQELKLHIIAMRYPKRTTDLCLKWLGIFLGSNGCQLVKISVMKILILIWRESARILKNF